MNLLKEHITDANFIGELIPQKKPFVMVDKLLFFSEEKVIAGLTVSNKNILSGVDAFTEPGIIEHMAQTIALHTGYQFHLNGKSAPTGYIGAIKNVQIHSLPKINDELKTTVSIVQEFMGVTLVKITTHCNNVMIAEGEMKTVLA